MLSTRCTYGLQALLALAAEADGACVPTRVLSERLGLSFSFLSKVLRDLTEAGLVHSHRGPQGGVALARPADAITFKEVVVLLDGPKLFEACVLGLPGCGHAKPCPMHEAWTEVRSCLVTAFEQATPADLVGHPGGLTAWLAALEPHSHDACA